MLIICLKEENINRKLRARIDPKDQFYLNQLFYLKTKQLEGPERLSNLPKFIELFRIKAKTKFQHRILT